MSLDPLELTTAISESYLRYLTISFRLRDPDLSRLFRTEMGKFHFTNGPILEATPAFKTGSFLKDLVAEGLLERRLEDFIYDSHRYLLHKPLYLHQDKAIRKALRGRNFVISAGTSSGKTECFLIPILNSLIRQHAAGELGPGVRALLLYPMNALANDQLRRLRQLGSNLARSAPEIKITFGRYVGDTDEEKHKALERFRKEHQGEEPPPGELLSRTEMRTSPPHILITNYAMLEYLLLRPGDCDLFDGPGARHWKFLVLDEAHIYNGAAGIEMAMLIRRLKDRVQSNTTGRLQCIATSATLVSEETDLPKVAQFATNLFGEPFDWKHADKVHQDVVNGERNPRAVRIEPKFTPSLSFYTQVEEARERATDEKNLSRQIQEIAAEQGIPASVLQRAAADTDNPKALLYKILSHDARFTKLAEYLEANSRKFAECIDHLLSDNEAKAENTAAKALKSLVDLAAWARLDDDSLPLLPARYHLFVRSPEGAFLGFFPKTQIFLERRHKTPEGYPVFELASCRRCGQEYLVGRISADRKLVHSLSDPEARNKSIRYYLLKPATLGEEDEDESVAVPEGETEEKLIKLCARCGAIRSAAETSNCDCGNDFLRNMIEIVPKDGVLNKCLLCGLRSIDIVREFVFQQDAPAAVIVTTLYQKLEKSEPTQRKILSFSDSRQNAAFFAPYLEGTYDRILYRRLIVEALKRSAAVTDYRLQSLAEDVVTLANDYELFDPSLDQKQRGKRVWTRVIEEFCALDRRNCLEGVGLISFVPVFPNGWQPVTELLKSPWNLSQPEAAALYLFLVNSLRLNLAITFPDAGPSPKDEVFAPRNREYKFRGDTSDTKAGIYSWIPAVNRLNSRLQFLNKLYRRTTGREGDSSQMREMIGKIFDDFTTNWRDRGIVKFTDPRHGVLFQLDNRFWQVLQGCSGTDWFVCERCGTFAPNCVRGACPTFGCEGSLITTRSPELSALLEQNHYRHLYSNLAIARMTVHEHTAQLKQDKASDVQQKFVSGDVNVLSCSTTFELGVDLGELEIIFLRNVPPEPSNYVQRSGRAGRRTSSAGFTITFAQLRPHDLHYFAKPEEMVRGHIKPPVVEIRNEKIVRRHLHAVVFSSFWRNFDTHFGVADKFFKLRVPSQEESNGPEKLREFLAGKPDGLLEALKRIIPTDMQAIFDLENWGWIEGLFDPDHGSLALAQEYISSEYMETKKYYDTKEAEIRAVSSDPAMYSHKGPRLNADKMWAAKRLEAIAKEQLIDFLATHGVLPKHGFPVDVVELTPLHHIPAAKEIKLERDLRIAISEFAPGSQVVANGYLWQSAGLKVVKGQTWPVRWYAICPGCKRCRVELGTIDEDKPPSFACAACGLEIPNGEKHKMVDPIFGFTTSRETEPLRPGESRPKREFSTRPFFVSHEPVEKNEFAIGRLHLNCEYSPTGELAVICKGKKGLGFKICFECGFATSFEKKQRTSHKHPFGTTCTSHLRSYLHLGHRFKTDIVAVSVKTSEPSGVMSIVDNESFWLSLLYALIEGASQSLGIRRRDLDGCLYPRAGRPGVVLFDTVPGGAGHVKRLMDEKNFQQALLAAKVRLEPSKTHECGEETSCYGCLRTYENQFCHEQLRRGPVLEFLNANL